MVKRKALMESISSNLQGFLKKNRQKFITAGQEVPARQTCWLAPGWTAYRLSDSGLLRWTDQTFLCTDC